MKMILQSYFIKIIGVSLLLFSALHLNAQAPVANFEVVGARSGCELLIVNFTNRSTGATSYRWDFGDGSAASTVQNPTKAYTRPGVYTVTLTATNASGSNVKTMTNYISVHANPQPSFTASPTSGCVPVTVNFRNTSTASSAIVKSEWNFGDGMVQESTAATIAHTYNTVNTYSISLTMTDANGCTATLSQPSLIRVNALPQPNFTVNPVETCDVPATIMFSSTTPGNIRSFLWDFGDGSTGTAANMPHEYTTKGKKTVKLTVTDANGCTNSITKTEVVNIADFTTNFTAPDKVCLGTESIFTNTSSGTSHTWFINGVQQQASTSSTFRYTFPALGTYKVKLISKNPIGCESAPVEKDVTVIPPTEVQISPNADKHLCLDANQNQNVSFSTTIVSTNGQPITGWEWYVNGTRVGTNENLTYTFPGKGTYTVSLRVRDAVCTGWKDANAPVAVEVHQPTVDFDTVSNNQLGCLVDGKFPVQFNATSDGTIAKWTWTVNGSPMSSMQNPLHTFTNTGVYKVKLAIEDIYGCKNVKEDSIKIGKKIDPELYKNFTSSSPVICYGPQNSIVTFNADPNLPNEWTMLRWYWYNEADERLFKQDRYVTFVDYPRDSRADEVGDFTISFTPYHYACKSDEVKSTWTQTVLPPVAKFGIIAQTSYPAMCDKGRPTTFVDMSQEVRTYTWDFGDKTGANAKNTTLTGHPIGEKGAPANHRLWELKENGVVVISEILRKENINPVFTYKDYGTYLVTLTTETDTVNIPDGCKDTWTSAIVVTKVNPGMNITTAKELCLGTALEAEDISTTEVGGKMSEWLWNFGDGNTGNTEKISYVYPQAGKYNLRLRVTDMYGCQGTTASVPITIWKNPTFDAATIVNPRECAFRAIKFTDNAVSQEATARLKSWEWTFEAGNSITISNNFNGTYKWTDINGNVIVNDTTSKNPSHTFTNTSPATKSVTLKVTDEHECSFQSSIQTILSRVTANIALADTVVPLGADYCYNKNVRLVNSSSTSTYSVASKWDLGDKSPEIGPLTNGNIALQVPPVFTYEDFGKDTTLTIRLVVTERTDVNPTAPGCTDIAYKTVRISRPVSRFSADVNHLACPTPPRPIQFSSAESTTTISSVAWNFGDATPVSTMPNPQHIYEEPGEFAVSLQVTDKFGCVDTRVIDPFITVDGPKGKATAAPNRVCVPFPVTFTAKEVEKAVSARWVFGDGDVHIPSIADVEIPVRHTYTHGDTFIPVLELKDDKECTHYVKANPIDAHMATPDFIVQSPIICSQTPVEFVDISASSHPITAWVWQLENIDTGFRTEIREQNPSRTLPYGTYKVRFTVSVSGCDFDLIRDSSFQVYAMPIASFTTVKDEINKFEELLFTNTSTPAANSSFPTFYIWDFGDNSPERTTFNTSHMFTREGSYDVTLSAFEHENCVDVATKTILVRNKISIPNVFTPNGDGINDIFIEGGFFKNIIIINRWGQTMYEGTEGWDGRVNGVEASPGTYFYIITTFDDEVVKGALTLLRN